MAREAIEVSPSPWLLHSMRSVGYSFRDAVADLIDNSITAGAHSVFVDVDSVRGEHFAMLDDGRGLSRNEIIESLRFGGDGSQRDSNDLGRFGLGLKTASLSQARSLTVVSKQGETINAMRWDIDHVLQHGTWTVLVLDEDEVSELPHVDQLREQPSGTLVLWHRLDLLLEDTRDGEVSKLMLGHLQDLREHLSWVFHRFLSGNQRNGLRIDLNGLPIKAVDVFLDNLAATQVSPVETVEVDGKAVEYQAFTLPHMSRLPREVRSRTDLGESMRDFQGLYIYRNKRLVAWGKWYGLTKRTELTKQTRVRVDITNESDKLWQLDIKKSRVSPPASFLKHMSRTLDSVLDRSRRVHVFRGRREDPVDFDPVWVKRRPRQGFQYEMNEDHVAVQRFVETLDDQQRHGFRAVVKLLEGQLPFYDIYQEMAGNNEPEKMNQDSAVEQLLRSLRDAGFLGRDADSVFAHYRYQEPFSESRNLRSIIQSILRE